VETSVKWELFIVGGGKTKIQEKAMKMNPVVHFEMPAVDAKRMSDFYAQAFGWKAQTFGPEMGNYTLVTTTEMGENKFPKEPGRINGGFFQKTKDDQHPSVVIAVDDIREAMKKVAEAGGTVLGGMRSPGEPDEIPGVGWYASILDTEGNRVSMLQPLPMGTSPQ
jgi:predicted enzyme related to lactoylglutathione lyase